MSKNNSSSKATQAVHAGSQFDEKTSGVNTPIYPSTAYEYLKSGEVVYPRYYNTPNQNFLVEKLCALEGADYGMVYSSGMAAITTTLLGILRPDDHILFQVDLYGGTVHMIIKQLEKFNIEYTYVEGRNPEDFEKAIQPNTKAIYFETISNPLMRMVDAEAIATFAKSKGLITLVDNTFASPINLNPIELGIDIVLHSGTKYLGGHSDLIFGVMVTNSEELKNQIFEDATDFGGSINAMTAYLIERSLKTLDVRVWRQNKNAQQLAEWLESHPKIKRVFYPGLDSHPERAVAKKHMKGFGGMVAFELTDEVNAFDFQKKLKLIISAVSLGGVETLICSPVLTSHAKMPVEEREKAGITDQLLRFSVGIESVEDIKSDIEQALS